MERIFYSVIPWGADQWAVHSGDTRMRTQFTTELDAVEFATSIAGADRLVHGRPTGVRIFWKDGSLRDEWEFGREQSD